MSARRRGAVLDIVGLTQPLLARMPRLARWAAARPSATIEPTLPAVTCTAQSTYLTGLPPSAHGAVANGWYFREDCEIRFWRQSNRLVAGPKLWDLARSLDPEFTCANLFWWFNMYSSVDVSVTPRPMYPADGRKIPDIYTQPANLRDQLQRQLGSFPLFDFWGPATSIRSSRWIADAARYVEEKHRPGLSLVYLPHLDYGLQRHGPASAAIDGDLAAIDEVASDLIAFYEREGIEVLVLSEYGISPVSAPVALNRVLRQEGLIEVREELGRELLDPGASRAFAVADHQVAHVYVNDRSRLSQVRALLERQDGIEQVYERHQRADLDHPRAGDLVVVAAEDRWLSYYYWMDDRRAPDFARTVDIHRKPGYDPAELFIDPALMAPKLKILGRLAQKKLGFRTLLDVIPLDGSAVRGSHGRQDVAQAERPLLVGRCVSPSRAYLATEVRDVMLRLVGLSPVREEELAGA